MRIHLILFTLEALLVAAMIMADIDALAGGAAVSLWDVYLFALLFQAALSSAGVLLLTRRGDLRAWTIPVLHLLLAAPSFLAGLGLALTLDPFGRHF